MNEPVHRSRRRRRKSALSKQQSEIVEIVYRLGQASVADVRRQMVDPPGYSSVRKQLEIIERKGHLGHYREGRRYIYRPTVPRAEAAQGALSRVVRSFFRGDVSAALAALVSLDDSGVSEETLEALLREARATCDED